MVTPRAAQAYGTLNVAIDSEVDVTFSFLKDGEPVELVNFYFSLFDIDSHHGVTSQLTDEGELQEWDRRETVCVDDDVFDRFVAPGLDAGELDVEYQNTRCDGTAGASTRFNSLQPGFACDNPNSLAAGSREGASLPRLTF